MPRVGGEEAGKRKVKVAPTPIKHSLGQNLCALQLKASHDRREVR
jgi:hypothetical protein